MANQNWVTAYNAYAVSGTSKGKKLENSKTKTVVSPGVEVAGQAVTFPPGFILPGQLIRTTFAAEVSCEAAAEAALTFNLMWGGVSGVSLIELKTKIEKALKEQTIIGQFLTRITEQGTESAGEKAKAITTGYITGALIKVVPAETVASTIQAVPLTKPGAETEINTAEQKTLTLAATWSKESAESTVTVVQWLVELLN